MLSRIAESLFWLARYIERAEDTARILDVNYHMLLEQSQQSYRLRWEPLIVMAGEEKRFRDTYDRGERAKTSSSFSPSGRTIPAPSCSASPRPARTPAPFATASRARCGKTSTASTTWSTASIREEEIAAGPHRFCDEIKFGSHRFHGVTDATLAARRRLAVPAGRLVA